MTLKIAVSRQISEHFVKCYYLSVNCKNFNHLVIVMFKTNIYNLQTDDRKLEYLLQELSAKINFMTAMPIIFRGKR